MKTCAFLCMISSNSIYSVYPRGYSSETYCPGCLPSPPRSQSPTQSSAPDNAAWRHCPPICTQTVPLSHISDTQLKIYNKRYLNWLKSRYLLLPKLALVRNCVPSELIQPTTSRNSDPNEGILHWKKAEFPFIADSSGTITLYSWATTENIILWE